MARSLKTRGMSELASLRSRVKRQAALGRISEPDRLYLLDCIGLVEARIINMRELNEQGEEEG